MAIARALSMGTNLLPHDRTNAYRMESNMKSFNSGLLAIGILLLQCGSLAFAGNQQAGRAVPEPTRQERQEMAKMHRKMADCLDSKKPMSECHSEMMKQCRARMEKGGSCPMMGDQHGAD